jgi:hypothetical protein
MSQSAKPKHEIGDLVMKRRTTKKQINYIIGLVKTYRVNYSGHATAYPWGIYWINDEIITTDGCKYYTAGEVTRFKNILNEYTKTI